MKNNKILKGKTHVSGAACRFMARPLLSIVLLSSSLVVSQAHALSVHAWTDIGLTVTEISGGATSTTDIVIIPVGSVTPYWTQGGPTLQTVNTNLPEDSFYLSDDGGGWHSSDDLAGCGSNPCSIYEGWQWSADSISYPYLMNFGGGSTEGGYIQGQTTVVSVLELDNPSNYDWSVTFSFSGSSTLSSGGATSAAASTLITMDTLTGGSLTLGSSALGGPADPYSGMFTLNLPANTLERLTLTLDVQTYAEDIPQVPLPTAAWLFGSGLFGLIGLARRNAE